MKGTFKLPPNLTLILFKLTVTGREYKEPVILWHQQQRTAKTVHLRASHHWEIIHEFVNYLMKLYHVKIKFRDCFHGTINGKVEGMVLGIFQSVSRCYAANCLLWLRKIKASIEWSRDLRKVVMKQSVLQHVRLLIRYFQVEATLVPRGFQDFWAHFMRTRDVIHTWNAVMCKGPHTL
jgi:hypothetical protein